jgi:hypothetical protein
LAEFDSFPFEEGEGSQLTEERWNEYFLWMRTTGVLSADTLLDPNSELAVNEVPMSVATEVQVEEGSAFIEGFMYIQTDGPEVLPIIENNSGNPRIDLVVCRLDKTNNIISNFVIEGDADVNPVRPDPIQNSTIWDLPLAEVYVPDGATTIPQADITDVRVRSVQGDGGSASVTLESVGSGESLVADSSLPPDLKTKSLIAGTNISMSSSGSEITINASSAPADPPVCIVGLSSNQTVMNTADDQILFDTAIFDSGSMFDSMNNSIVVPEDGIYEIKVNVAWTGDVLANGVVSVYAIVNGTTTVGQSNTLAVGNVSVSNNFSVLVELNATDVVSITAENNSGVNLDVDAVGDVFPYLSVIKVRS